MPIATQASFEQRQRLTPENEQNRNLDHDQRHGGDGSTPSEERRRDGQKREPLSSKHARSPKRSRSTDRGGAGGGAVGSRASSESKLLPTPPYVTADGNGTTAPSHSSSRHGSSVTLNGSVGGSGPVAGGSGAGTLAGLTGDRHRGDDPVGGGGGSGGRGGGVLGPTMDAGGKSPNRRGTTNGGGGGGGAANGGPPVERERDRPRAFRRLGLGQGLLTRSTAAGGAKFNTIAGVGSGSGSGSQNGENGGSGGGGGGGGGSGVDGPSTRGATEGSGDRGGATGMPPSRNSSSSLESGQHPRGEREREGEGRGGGGSGAGGNWKREGYRGGDYHRAQGGSERGGGSVGGVGPSHYRGGSSGNVNGSGGGGVPLGRGVVRERDRPDSPRDRGR